MNEAIEFTVEQVGNLKSSCERAYFDGYILNNIGCHIGFQKAMDFCFYYFVVHAKYDQEAISEWFIKYKQNS